MKVHYNATAGEAIVELRRVAATCGAITQHATPQPMVKETADLTLVTCGNCLNNLRRKKS